MRPLSLRVNFSLEAGRHRTLLYAGAARQCLPVNIYRTRRFSPSKCEVVVLLIYSKHLTFHLHPIMQRFLIFITVLGTAVAVRMPEDRAGGARFQPSPSVPEAGTVPLQLSFGVVEQRTSIRRPYDDTYNKPEGKRPSG